MRTTGAVTVGLVAVVLSATMASASRAATSDEPGCRAGAPEEPSSPCARDDSAGSGEAAPDAEPTRREQLSVVLDDRWLVLDHDAKADWRAGPPERMDSFGRGVSHAARAPVDRDALPEALSGWSGREVVVYDGTDEACRGRVASLALVARYTPHAGTRREWSGLGSEEDGLSDEEVAARVADEGAARLLGRIEAEGEGCRSAEWARAASLEPPRVLARRDDVPRELTKRLTEAFHGLDAWETVQADFRDRGEGEGPWDGGAPGVDVFADDADTLAFAAAERGPKPSCGEFRGELSALWRVGGEALERIPLSRFSGMHLEVHAVLDADGDGAIEIVGSGPGLLERLVLRRSPDGYWSVEQRIRPRSNACPC